MKKKTIYLIGFVKILFHFIVLNQKLHNNICGTISRPNQDYFWRRIIKKTIIHKVFIFCYNNKIIFLTKLPDVNIIFLIQFMEFRMSRIRIRIFQYFWEGLERFVSKKSFNQIAIKILSRSARYAKQAVISSLVSLGNSTKISSIVIPDAK